MIASVLYHTMDSEDTSLGKRDASSSPVKSLDVVLRPSKRTKRAPLPSEVNDMSADEMRAWITDGRNRSDGEWMRKWNDVPDDKKIPNYAAGKIWTNALAGGWSTWALSELVKRTTVQQRRHWLEGKSFGIHDVMILDSVLSVFVTDGYAIHRLLSPIAAMDDLNDCPRLQVPVSVLERFVRHPITDTQLEGVILRSTIATWNTGAGCVALIKLVINELRFRRLWTYMLAETFWRSPCGKAMMVACNTVSRTVLRDVEFPQKDSHAHGCPLVESMESYAWFISTLERMKGQCRLCDDVSIPTETCLHHMVSHLCECHTSMTLTRLMKCYYCIRLMARYALDQLLSVKNSDGKTAYDILFEHFSDRSALFSVEHLLEALRPSQ